MNSSQWFDVKAEAFRIMTGHMAPGKDVAATAAYFTQREEREEAWRQWLAKNSATIRAFEIAISRYGKD